MTLDESSIVGQRSDTRREPSPAHWLTPALRASGFFAAVVALLAAASYLDRLRHGDAADFMASLAGWSLGFLPWLGLSPLVYEARKQSALRGAPPRVLAMQILALAATCAIVSALYIFLVNAPLRGLTAAELVASVPLMTWAFDVFIFGLCLVAGRAEGERLLKEQAASERSALAARLLRLEREAATLETRELRARFSSHFVLNALSNILGLVRNGESNAAENAVLALSEILKGVARDGGASQSTLQNELKFLDAYLRFQKIRYPNATVRVDVAPEVRTCMVPTYLLQPIIENAFKHGLGPGGALSAELRIRSVGERLQIEFSNSVPDNRKAIGCEGEGFALTRTRLELYAGADYCLARSMEADQHIVKICIPRRWSSA